MDTVDRLLSQWRMERPDLDVSALGISIRVEFLAKLLRRDAARSLAAVGLKPWEYDVLSALRRQGRPFSLPASQLARASLLTAGAMTTRIDHLEQQGLVERVPDPVDRRGVRVMLTSKGRATVDRAIETRLQAADAAVEGMTRKQRALTDDALRLLLESIEA